MAYVATRFLLPDPRAHHLTSGYSSAAVISASTSKIAIIGQFWNPTRAAKSIRKVGFRFGTVVKAGGSGLTVSLQDVSLTSNPPQPDGTQDQTAAIANGNASFASSTWILTGALSADRSVNHGDLVATVIEFDGGGRLGSDSVQVTGYSPQTANMTTPAMSLYTGSWASLNRIPNILFECSDGTFATLVGSFPSSVLSSNSFALNSTPDEYGNKFQVPFNCKVDGFWANVSTQSASDFEIILYSGTTALATLAVDASTTTVSTTTAFFTLPSEITLTANTDYIIAIRPTVSGQTVFLYNMDVAVAGHLGLWDIATCEAVTRTDQGSWSSSTTTRRNIMGISVSAIDNGAGGSGGIMVSSGLTGGLRG